MSQQESGGEHARADGDPAERDPAGGDPAEGDPAEGDAGVRDPAEDDPAEGDPAEGFGGERTDSAPDESSSARWDREAQDEDALLSKSASADGGAAQGTVSG